MGVEDFEGKLDTAMTAHPRVCPETGEMLFFGYSMFSEPFLNYYRVSKEGALVQSEAIELPWQFYGFRLNKSSFFADSVII